MPRLSATHIRQIMEAATDDGFHGFSGACGQAAVAIDRVLFQGRGTIVGAFNTAFLARGRHIGHVAVRHGQHYWDADARPKNVDDIDSWGMLDPDDPDYIAEARRLGFDWTEETAEGVTLTNLTADEALALFRCDAIVDDLQAILQRAHTLIMEP